MDFNSKNIQLQYEGYCKTPLLWNDNSILNIQQFSFENNSIAVFNKPISTNERLGKRVERFVEHQLSGFKNTHIIAKNKQINQGTTTIGEIDFILLKNQIPIHLEVVYKFYLFDENNKHNGLEHWIGPNKKDSLVEKLIKLKDKQFPLLYKEQTLPFLESLKINPTIIQQQVLFKAQLFVPLNLINHNFEGINNQCIKGFYIHLNNLQQFTNCKFFIPTKQHWLLDPHTQINWLLFDIFFEKITELASKEISPLCWIKKPNGQLQKFFVIWWN